MPAGVADRLIAVFAFTVPVRDSARLAMVSGAIWLVAGRSAAAVAAQRILQPLLVSARRRERAPGS